MSGIGTIVNAIAIVIGSLIGVGLSKKLAIGENKAFLQIMSGFVLVTAIQMVGTANTGVKFIIVMVSVLLGALIGELLQLEKKTEILAKKLEFKITKKNESKGIQAFIFATLLFCVGPVAIVGSLQDGLKHDSTLLLTKAVVDGSFSIIFASTMGIGILFSALPILIYQGSLTFLSQHVQTILAPHIIESVSASGGMLLLFLSFNMLGIAKINVTNLVPSLFVAGVLADLIW